MSRSAFTPLDRYTTVCELSEKVRRLMKRAIGPIGVAIALESLLLTYSRQPGAEALILIGFGCIAVLAAWGSAINGLPLLPMLALQNLIVYGIPIVAHHEILKAYPADFINRAGLEVLIYDIALIVGWRLGMQMFHPASAVSHVLHEFNREGLKGWARLGFALIGAATAAAMLAALPIGGSLLDALPSGSQSILFALEAVASACGFFLVSMLIGCHEANTFEKLAFWILLVVNGMISAQDYILSSVAANLITVAIGFFWSTSRIPWRYLAVTLTILSFFNTGKTTMREHYWNIDGELREGVVAPGLAANYIQWAHASYDAVVENSESTVVNSSGDTSTHKNQTLLDRIDNLQNLLFVIDAIETEHVKPLYGKTYSLIPPLLVPRILWPDKPRSHEGQVLLNVYFGRQDMSSTIETYIAWGLLAEAYGNFGPIAGSIVLGVVIGFVFAWVENYTARKLVMSMQGFLSLSLMMNLMNSFEMVASVLVTAIFQSFSIIIVACLPFVQRSSVRPREEVHKPAND